NVPRNRIIERVSSNVAVEQDVGRSISLHREKGPSVNRIVDLNSEVEAARRSVRPIVALESTIIAHGMPWPQNVETALAVEAEVRRLGAIPATIAIVDGRLKVGLTADELERLGRAGPDTAKVSRRDLPIVVARGGTGATTVAATMIIAALAKIRVFA